MARKNPLTSTAYTQRRNSKDQLFDTRKKTEKEHISIKNQEITSIL